MISLSAYRDQWFGNIRGDLLAGLVVSLALIPEAIAFSIIAGVDPKVGLYASFAIAVVIAITGGRPGMISAATAATAVLMVTLVRDHGLQYLLAASVLAGLMQIAAGFLKLGALMRFVSRSVMTGFVNALAILILMAQLPELINVPWLTYVLVASGLGIIYLFPYVTKAVPSPLICILVLTGISIYFGLDVRTVGDMGELPSTMPMFLIPDIPLTVETFLIILPYSAAVAAVGLLESLMTTNIVDDLTDTPSNNNRECIGQGVANAATGFRCVAFRKSAMPTMGQLALPTEPAFTAADITGAASTWKIPENLYVKDTRWESLSITVDGVTTDSIAEGKVTISWQPWSKTVCTPNCTPNDGISYKLYRFVEPTLSSARVATPWALLNPPLNNNPNPYSSDKPLDPLAVDSNNNPLFTSSTADGKLIATINN